MGGALLLLALGTAARAHPMTECMEGAGARYHINPVLLWSIAKVESSFSPLAENKNPNGTTDIGVMQINSAWLPTLKRYGIDRQALQDPCTNIYVGAWILAQNIRRYGYNWEAVGAYNATTQAKRVNYARKVLSLAQRAGEKVRGG
ncbi:MAG: lytic transglycosylase domain-containing protein [Sulfuritalea sp.]|nr:lytic transglycosylase domain-containing protein [Sulfuritalea sp.]